MTPRTFRNAYHFDGVVVDEFIGGDGRGSCIHGQNVPAAAQFLADA